jgi:hypothetical protein
VEVVTRPWKRYVLPDDRSVDRAAYTCYRQRILIQLNRGEGWHRLARAVFYGQQ